MDRFEQDLRDSLRRNVAPTDLTAKVLARVDAEQQAKTARRWFRIPTLAWAAALVLVLLMVGLGAERRQRERVAGEQARRQVELALRIAGSKLQLAEMKVQQLSDKTQE